MSGKYTSGQRGVSIVIAFPGAAARSAKSARGRLRDALRLGGVWLIGGSLALATLVLTHASWGLLWDDSTSSVELGSVVEAPDPARDPETNRQMILDLVRDHRRSASEAWHTTLTEAIHTEALEAAVDPLLVASIVAKESSFKSRVVSRKGAVGLMQLRPWVAEDVATRSDVEWNGLATLHDPSLNVRLGITYYKELIERFDGDVHLALAAYNNGPTRLSRRLRNGSFSGSRYADSILALYRDLSEQREAGVVRTASIALADSDRT